MNTFFISRSAIGRFRTQTENGGASSPANDPDDDDDDEEDEAVFMLDMAYIKSRA
jgi:hypothetical protein